MIKSQINGEEKDIGFLLASHRALNITLNRYKIIQKSFSSWEEFFNASLLQLNQVKIDKRGLEKFIAHRKKFDPEEEIQNLRKHNAMAITIDCPTYPQELAQIYDSPAIIFAQGILQKSDFPSISVVGARRITPYGKRCTESIVKDLAQSGVTIVSGLAYGVDLLSHQTAVSSGARTIAVLGGGFNHITPTAHIHQAQQWLKEEKLVLLSEFFPDVEPRPENFPRRNRIITGLSRATIVIDGAKKSGSLISGYLAQDQNREVFAVPGNIFAPNCEGCNRLIAENIATPALSGGQILEHLGFKPGRQNKKKIPDSLSEEDRSILNLLHPSCPQHVDEISRMTRRSHQQISSTLTLLEMQGFVKNMGNNFYITLI